MTQLLQLQNTNVLFKYTTWCRMHYGTIAIPKHSCAVQIYNNGSGLILMLLEYMDRYILYIVLALDEQQVRLQ